MPSEKKVNPMIKECLVRFRKGHNLSQELFAKAIKAGYSTVAGWEKSLSSPDMENMLKILNAFGCTFEKVMEGAINPIDLNAIPFWLSPFCQCLHKVTPQERDMVIIFMEGLKLTVATREAKEEEDAKKPPRQKRAAKKASDQEPTVADGLPAEVPEA
ncbi:MAG: helix-turn-helix domain-containing protein [Deltaproteobacteria bacterium]|jgi:transcriptional regulator with XRE-family HTH domain|nr:helix-turn-helix domain-containing protein [Deltaproteobacteria bacterium]